LELRVRIVEAVDRGVGSLPKVAALFGVSINCVANYLHLRDQTGCLVPRPNPGGRPPAIPEDRHEEVRQLLAAHPDLRLDEIRDRLGVTCSLAAISRTLKKLGLPRKKKRSVRRSSSGRTSKPTETTGRSGKRNWRKRT
jgi:transposase